MSLTKVAIIGANGKVGRLLTTKLKSLKTEFEPLAIVRNDSQASHFEKLGINCTVISLEDTVENLSKALKGCNAVVFTAGAGGGSLERTFSIDLDGAVKIIEVCQKNKIERFIMVSAIRADERDFWYNSSLRSYYIAKKYADSELRKSGLKYTILQPGYLKDGKGSGKVAEIQKALSAEKFEDTQFIYRDDVAQAIVASLKNNRTIGKTIPLINGDIPIDEFLDTIVV
ncbi:hypothetical protein PACTADRAFT_31321 [Pachysolen tannophilus NRRL Y-2460]|uniref:NAD(P)-binding domain-containing protein n=1 Tax=Pachysolen tannophilus NRRL Y-2460 TaxID=669874 RepID=A0A1E4U1M0_PACTA|nr:hypothetical protein PACTADRAFT_31321 [Pachysolen tannophilus NRRL Y-2460]